MGKKSLKLIYRVERSIKRQQIKKSVSLHKIIKTKKKAHSILSQTGKEGKKEKEKHKRNLENLPTKKMGPITHFLVMKKFANSTV